MKTLCSSLCDTWYSACSSEFYASSVDGKLSACLDGALVCSKLDAIVESGAELCARMGYRVADTKCYDGQSMPHPTMCTLYGVCELIVLCYHFGIAVAATPGIERKAKGTDSKTKAVLNKLRCVRFWMVLLMVLVDRGVSHEAAMWIPCCRSFLSRSESDDEEVDPIEAFATLSVVAVFGFVMWRGLKWYRRLARRAPQVAAHRGSW